ncbi:MAG: pantoate--beta-alanine ligase, partial [Gammaproteobacteria bacterium]|nr:pantoate--beta-alanine ligase [Gammaproteobacteria bacterium]
AVVPTMGNLHSGHIHLVNEAHRHGDVVVCTIFVNPMQFGKNEDLDAYPRTLEQDRQKLAAAGCTVLFAPPVSEIYPDGLEQQTVVSVPKVSERHCGISRPGHFDGVATVVSKLFNLVQPDTALFGLKDYQQFMVITRMVADLCFPIKLIGVETQRESSGLALSSRNGYLTPDEKQRAAVLYQTLLESRVRLQAGASIDSVEAMARVRLEQAGFRPDYYSVCDALSLEPAQPHDSDLVILAAAWMGTTRLIDNLRVQLSSH